MAEIQEKIHSSANDVSVKVADTPFISDTAAMSGLDVCRSRNRKLLIESVR